MVNQIAVAAIKVTTGYRLEVATLLEGKLQNIRVDSLPSACEFTHFSRQC